MRNCECAIHLAWAFAIGMLFNGEGHIGIMAVRRRYFPGGFTAFLLLGLDPPDGAVDEQMTGQGGIVSVWQQMCWGKFRSSTTQTAEGARRQKTK